MYSSALDHFLCFRVFKSLFHMVFCVFAFHMLRLGFFFFLKKNFKIFCFFVLFCFLFFFFCYLY